ncbi:PLD nuclease N-terminal domain-containing protein [Pseudolysinimonas sp.]|uniref:PLD nuclease N-terminal domain-containing protein n=1 Tax=Pseudolysinimonas sp. TaxID=2680009 RepID=UPI003F7E7B35
MIRYLPFIVEVILVVVALVDLVLIDASRVRGLPKWGWIMLAIILPVIGPILWFVVGRERLEPRNHGRYASDGSVERGPRSAPRAPDDDPEFLRRLSREQQQAQRIRDLERQLEERSADDQKPDDTKQAE